MKPILIIVAVALAGIVVAVILLARNHRKWLDAQNPSGVWQATDDTAKVTLQFNGGPHEGTYKQLIESGEKRTKEFGHWSARANDLKMLIMATDIKNHPRFGQDTSYRISYVGPTRIKIEGPDREGVVYEKAPDGSKLDFDR
jgi:hypothetical protein